MTACFRGVRAVDGQIAPDSDSGNRRRTRPHPEWNHLQAKLFLDSGIQKYLPTRPPALATNTNRMTEGGKKACGGKLHERKPPACDHDDAAAGHCTKSLKSL